MLDSFLRRMAATPFVDGAADCALTVADWVEACGHADPAADLRGRYTTALGRERLLKRLGGLDKVMSERLARVGLDETPTAARRDVGLIVLGGRPLAAICVGAGWAAKTNGLWVGQADEVLKAWRV